LLSLIKDSSFNATYALQISFNYLYPFESYLGVPAISEYPVYCLATYLRLTGQHKVCVITKNVLYRSERVLEILMYTKLADILYTSDSFVKKKE